MTEQEQDSPLPPELRDELRHAGPEPPGRDLKSRTIEVLRAERLLGDRHHQHGRGRRELALAAAVAATAVFLAGLWAGGLWSGPAVAPDPSPTDGLFLLLLHEPVGGLPVTGRTDQELTAEYAAWARAEARAGRLVRAEKLAAESRRVGGARVPDTPAPTEISGFFLIRASTLQQATEIARNCPHVRYGGAIELRPIVSS